MRSTKLKEDVLKAAMQLIQTLDPRPGLSINTGESDYVIPDVLVHKHQGHWVVELNQDSVPRLKINQRQRHAIHPQQSAISEVDDYKLRKP